MRRNQPPSAAGAIHSLSRTRMRPSELLDKDLRAVYDCQNLASPATNQRRANSSQRLIGTGHTRGGRSPALLRATTVLRLETFAAVAEFHLRHFCRKPTALSKPKHDNALSRTRFAPRALSSNCSKIRIAKSIRSKHSQFSPV